MTFLTGSCAIVLSLLANSPPASSQPAEPRKPRLAVLDFHVGGKVDVSGSGVAAALVRKEFNASGKYDLMDRAMMKERMAEKDWGATTECDQVKCLVKYGTSLDVEKIIGGSISSFGDTWFVELRFVDVNTGREERTFARQHSGKMEDTLDIVAEGARELLGTATSKPVVDRKPPPQAPSGKTLTLYCDDARQVSLELVRIEADTFTMGSNDGNSDEKPPHEVTIGKAFYMGKFEVTQAQWQAVTGSNPSKFKGDGNLPVEQVSWDDCQEFCKKMSAKTGQAVRLPTEAEWEYACRAGSKGKFCFGDNDSGLDAYAWYGNNSGGKTHPVGQKKKNAWDLYDMHGNVWEWCADWYGAYSSESQNDPQGASSGPGRVLRGGSWLDLPAFCRSALRLGSWPVLRFHYIGLRVAVGT